jgi:hypothetical protein
VVGRSANDKLKSVTTCREIDVFVSRLNPDTDDLIMKEFVTEVLPNINTDCITCTRLVSKYEELYSSFHVCVRVPASDMKGAIAQLMNADLWPSGLLVRRYFRPRNGQ